MSTVIDGETGLIETPGPSTALAPLYTASAGMAQMRELQAFVNTYLRPSPAGTTEGDYGIIPGTKKPTLLKSGADKLCDVYGLLPVYDYLARDVDWASGLFAYEMRCRLLRRDGGGQVGEGVGACNSQETRYQTTEWWNGAGAPPAEEGWQRTSNGKWNRKVAPKNPANLVNTDRKSVV